MKKIRAAPKIDFADSRFKSYEMFENTLILNLISWDEKTLKVIFSNCIQFSYKLGDFIENLYEIMEESDFLREALSHKYVKTPSIHPFRLFQLQDISDFPFIEVVAESVSVEKISG